MLAQSAGRRYRALIADDDTRCRESVASLLNVEGFQTVPVGGGLAVVDLLLEQINRRLLELDGLLASAEERGFDTVAEFEKAEFEKAGLEKAGLEKAGLEKAGLEKAGEPVEGQERGKAFDFLVLDYNMPDLTGLEVIAKLHQELERRVTARVRQRMQAQSVAGPLVPPAIVVSGEASSELERQVRKVGGFALVPKPIHPTQFREQVWKLVRSLLHD